MSNIVNKKITVSEIIDKNKFDKSKINIVKSGTGSGKSYYFLNNLHKDLNIKRNEILFITSRNITKEQQAKDYKETILLKNCRDIKRLYRKQEEKTPIITYNLYGNNLDIIKSEEFKVIVLDEIHAIFSDCLYNEEMCKTYDNIMPLLGKVLIFGATATTEGLEFEIEYGTELKGKLNYVLDKPIYPYKVKNIHIVYSQSFLDSILNKTEGKTMCMLYSANQVVKRMQNKKCTGLISTSNKLFDDDMQEVYDYIVENKLLPEGIDTIFFTSMGREGFEFSDKANIKNVIIQSSDPIAIKQFVGRYRNHIENLYIINSYLYNNVADKTPQQEYHNKEFRNLLYNSRKVETIGQIQEFKNAIRGRGKSTYSYLRYFLDISTDETKIHYIDFKQAEEQFINYATDQLLNKVIYSKEKKQEIVDYAFSIGLRMKDKTHKYTFNSLMQLLKNKGFNFVMENKQIRITNKKLQKYVTEEINQIFITPTVITLSTDKYLEYLKQIKGIDLKKEEQKELLKVSNQYFNTPTEIKTISKLNKQLLSLGYTIEAKSIGRADSRTTVWNVISLGKKARKNKEK